ncbi:hypothetical protein FDF11_03630 [Clostridium botulinum]|nr:hypothetical protein [Clostridium botulinum]NFR15147.1 hypothetical protein [Clostridium botulinum]NFR44358.1 hypothetical protein [Clostridium botulinum]NFS49789.1 hypothetical protein [Clostridium botulinum]
MEKLIEQLKQIYQDTNFAESTRDGHKVLLYNNEKLEWDEDFISKVIELAESSLDKEDLNSFTFLYDYLDEISSDRIDDVFGVNYIQNNSVYNEQIQKKIEVPGLVEVKIKITNKKLSKLLETLTFKETEDDENFVIASEF